MSEQQQEQQREDPSKMLVFKDWVPYGIRFWLYIIFLTIFQFANGIYFGNMSLMASDLGLTSNDTLMLSYTVLTGLAMYFPLAFRLKFRFPNRTNLLIAATVLMTCNLLVPHLHSMPALVAVCFIAGFFRLYGTFECFSNIIFKITPSYNYAVFLAFVFFIVIGVVQVHDISAAQITFFYNWQHVHYAAAGLLMVLIAAVIVFMRPYRAMPKQPLSGIDWLGMASWSVFILLLIFAAQYGEQFGWFQSPYICATIAIALLLLALNIWRMFHTNNNFLEISAFKAKNLWPLMVLFLIMDILLSTQHVLQNIFTGEIIGYGYMKSIQLKWAEFLGVLIGAVFSWQFMIHTNHKYKELMFLGMLAIVLYILSMYFIVAPEINSWTLYLPLMLAGFGHVVIFISLTVYANQNVIFTSYFQVLCILGFIRMGVAAPIGSAVYSRAMTGMMSGHLAQMGSTINPSIAIPYGQLGGTVSSEALLATLKELFGWSFIFGIMILIILACYRYPFIPLGKASRMRTVLPFLRQSRK